MNFGVNVLTCAVGHGKFGYAPRARMMKTRRRFCDSDIRRVLRRSLAEEFAGDQTTVILDEFGCAGARADIAVVNGKLHAYEIKSEVDTLDRIDNQVRGYGLVFDNVTAVVAVKHVEKLSKKIPTWWGITAVDCDGDHPALRRVRCGKKNPTIDLAALSRLLWRNEAFQFLKRLGHHDDLRRASAAKIRQRIVEEVSIAQVAAEVRRVLKLRGVNLVVQRRIQNGDSCTTEPIAVARQKNLNWLLSLQ